MKRFILSFLFCASLTFGGTTVNFAWDDNPEPEVTFYSLRERLTAETFKELANVDGDTLVASSEFENGIHVIYFVAGCEDASRTSPDSDSLIIFVQDGIVLKSPLKVEGLRLKK